MDELYFSLSVVSSSIPLIIVWVIGIALAVSRWRRHPRVSQFALIACVVMIVATVVNRMANFWLPLMAEDWVKLNQIRQISIAIGMVYTLISAAAWTMVLWGQWFYGRPSVGARGDRRTTSHRRCQLSPMSRVSKI
jgi:hypothetical protein